MVGSRKVRDGQAAQVMSCAQHIGDLIMPWPSGHFDTATEPPSGLVIESWTNSVSHFAQVMLTLIPHLSQVYVAMGMLLVGVVRCVVTRFLI